MANKTSLSQATDTITQIIRSLQDYPENELIILINTILQSTFQAIAQLGTKLPKELHWCKNIPSPPRSDHTIYSTADNTTHATANNALQQLSAADYATPDLLAVDNTTQHSVADDTTQEPTAVSSLKEAHPIKKGAPGQRQEKTDKYQVIEEEFNKQSKSFPGWMKNPESFWKSAEELKIKGEREASRFRDFIQHALALEGDADVPKFQRRFNSVVAFRMFRHYMPKAHATQDSTKKFLGLIGAAGDDIDSCQELLVSGRRRQEFCQRLSKSNGETNYGPLFLKVKDKIWTKPREKYWRIQFTKTLEALEERKFMKLPTMRVANTVARGVINARLGTIGCQLEEYRINLDGEKTNEKRSDEEDLDEDANEEEDNNTIVSEHVRTDLDGRRSPKRARSEVDLDVDCTRASKRSFTGPSATASKTSAVVSGLNTLQLNNGGELSHGFQNIASQAQGSGGNWQAQGGDEHWQAQGGDEHWQAQGGDEHWQAPNPPYAHYDVDVSYSGVHPYFEFPPNDLTFDSLLAAAMEEMQQGQSVTP